MTEFIIAFLKTPWRYAIGIALFAFLYPYVPTQDDENPLLLWGFGALCIILAAFLSWCILAIPSLWSSARTACNLRKQTKAQDRMAWESLKHLNVREMQILGLMIENASDNGMVRKFWHPPKYRVDGEIRQLSSRRIISESRFAMIGAHWLDSLDDEWWQIRPSIWAKRYAITAMLSSKINRCD